MEEFEVGAAVVVDTDSLNLRERPDLESAIVVTLGTGVSGTVLRGPEIANNFSWYEIETDEATGWCVGSFLATSESGSQERVFASGEAVYVNTDAVNLRSQPGLDADVVVVLTQHQNGIVLAGPEPADGHTWYQVESAEGTGWASAQFFGKGSADPAPVSFSIGTLVTTADGDAVNIRTEPGVGNSVVAQLLAGDAAEVIGGSRQADSYTWVNVQLGDTSGWAAKTYLTAEAESPFAIGTRVRVFDGELNLRASGSLGAEVVHVMPDATYAEVLEGPQDSDGYNWYRISTSRYGTGWAVGNYLTRG